jgi:hypothetical protein
MGAGSRRVDQHGLEPGKRAHPVRLGRLQRGDAGGSAGARFADPSRLPRVHGAPGPTATAGPGAASWATST